MTIDKVIAKMPRTNHVQRSTPNVQRSTLTVTAPQHASAQRSTFNVQRATFTVRRSSARQRTTFSSSHKGCT